MNAPSSAADITPDSTANRILELARQRFLTQGYSKVSVDELSKGLRISKKTLYASFASKEALLQEAVAQHLDKLKADIESIVLGVGNYREKLESFMQLVHEQLGWIAPFALEDIRTQVPSVWHYIVAFRTETISENLVSLLDEGKREGELDGKLESPLVVQLMLASLDALTQPSVLAQQSKSAPQMVEFVVRTALDGWRTQR